MTIYLFDVLSKRISTRDAPPFFETGYTATLSSVAAFAGQSTLWGVSTGSKATVWRSEGRGTFDGITGITGAANSVGSAAGTSSVTVLSGTPGTPRSGWTMEAVDWNALGYAAAATASIYRDGTLSSDSPWLTGAGPNAGDYFYVRATLVNGNTPTGTLSTWQRLSTTRSWSLSTPGYYVTGVPQDLESTLTIEIATSPAVADVVVTGTMHILVRSYINEGWG